MKTLLLSAFATALVMALYGCGVTQMAGDLARSGQKDVEVSCFFADNGSRIPASVICSTNSERI